MASTSASWTDTTSVIADQETPTVCAHKDCVSFGTPGYRRQDGVGDCLHLTRAHIGAVRKLLEALEALPPLPSETDTNPFTA